MGKAPQQSPQNFDDVEGIAVTPPSSNTPMRMDCAPRACAKCRSSKRKCDRLLPKCSRCTRLSASCAYYYMVGDSQKIGGLHSGLELSQGESAVDTLSVLGRPSLLEDLSASQILNILRDNKTDWPVVADSYFDYIHPWLGAVHPIVFHRMFERYRTTDTPETMSDATCNEGSESSPGHDPLEMTVEQALLLVMMYLVMRPVPGENPKAVWDEDYRLMKRVLSIMNCGEPTILLVQCLTLLCLYEYGHGNTLASYRTLGDAAMTARVLNVKPGQVGSMGSNWSSIEEEEMSGLWWSLFIMDQSIHSDQPAMFLPFILESPQPSTCLPASSVSCPRHHSPSFSYQPSQRTPVGKAITPDLTAIQKAAQVANILHRALRWESERDKTAPLPPISVFSHLDGEIRTATQTLIEDHRNWEMEIDCFAMCVSALFTLYLPYMPSEEMGSPSKSMIQENMDLACALAALKFACQIGIDIACRLYERLARNPGRGHTVTAPSAATSCYLTCRGFAERWRFYPEEAEYLDGQIRDRFESLQFFSGRWAIAESIMSQLEAKGLSRAYYLRGLSSLSHTTDAGGDTTDGDAQTQGGTPSIAGDDVVMNDSR
ncbi:hypothetical protein PG985_011758 [Apiospora marii]|uniref:Zn(2)-C6 fungal-type domain-containing protein n=1 Tax=Apiospora marii TaxID=335849 RepID=A0ABR1R0X6_9PEZI